MIERIYLMLETGYEMQLWEARSENLWVGTNLYGSSTCLFLNSFW